MVGLFILSRNSPTCNKIVRFTAWKCSHLGIVAVDQLANLVLDSVFVSDNHIGISLDFIQSTSTTSLVDSTSRTASCLGRLLPAHVARQLIAEPCLNEILPAPRVGRCLALPSAVQAVHQRCQDMRA
jgi:hypothetical protein